MDERKFSTDLFEAVRRVSADGLGVTRPSYSEAETRALNVLRESAISCDLMWTDDFAGNRWFVSHRSFHQKDLSCVVMGSHADSVSCGGNYDGLAGIVAGLLVARRLGRDAPVKVVALRGEEGAWFDRCYKGSLAMFGKLKPTGELFKAIARVTGSMEVKRASIKAFVELHIEQGPVLEKLGVPVGVVTAIRGNVRYRVRCHGEAGHSGTTPMEMRKDPVFATCALIHDLEEDWFSRYGAPPVDCVMTCGVIGTDPAVHAITRIADRVDFSIECRSTSGDVLQVFEVEFERRMREMEESPRGVRFEVLSRVVVPPVELQPDLIVAPGAPRLSSGAGHDAAVFAGEGIPTGMIFVRNANGSHNPNEAMDLGDFMIGVDALEATVRKLIG